MTFLITLLNWGLSGSLARGRKAPLCKGSCHEVTEGLLNNKLSNNHKYCN